MDAIESVDKTARVPSVQPGRAKAFVGSVKKALDQYETLAEKVAEVKAA